MRRQIRRAYDFVKEVLVEFLEDRGPLFAAAISFFGLISLVPLLLLAMAVFGHVIGSDPARRDVIALLNEFIPVGAEELEVNLIRLSEQSSVLGGLGLLALLWIGSQVFAILQQVMNIALGVKGGTSFVRVRAVALGMVVVAGLMFALSLGITSLLTAVRGFHMSLWGITPGDLEAIWDLIGVLVPFIISVLAFTFIYRFLPAGNVGTTGPIVGGITAGVLFEIAKHAFRWYVTNVVNYSAVYGSLGGVVVLVIWIYYVSMITVLSAEVASVYARRESERGRRSR